MLAGEQDREPGDQGDDAEDDGLDEGQDHDGDPDDEAEEGLRAAVGVERLGNPDPDRVPGLLRSAERRILVGEQVVEAVDPVHHPQVAGVEVVELLRVAAGEHHREPGEHDHDRGADAVQVGHDQPGDRDERAEEGGQAVASLGGVVGCVADWVHVPSRRLKSRLVAPTRRTRGASAPYKRRPNPSQARGSEAPGRLGSQIAAPGLGRDGAARVRGWRAVLVVGRVPFSK